MPKGNKNIKPRWKKGESGNPKGRPKISAEERTIRTLTSKEFADIANLIIKGSIAELRAIAKDETQPAIRVMIASVAVKTISKGDMSSLDTLLNRMIGKVKDTTEHIGNVSAPMVVLTLPRNGSEIVKEDAGAEPPTTE